ncbi:hypothetical protein SNL152K_4575 [Streptomyces sp. NL15-2K]|nr:hypothetical protein SNL152K_4575 [Streptomyces sp. NL15-2K]
MARAIRKHTEVFEPVPVTMPWNDPRPAETPAEAKPRTHRLA